MRDRLTASRMGVKAVEFLLEGKSNIVVVEENGRYVPMDIVFALTTDRMYKKKLKEGDLDKYSNEEIAAMEEIHPDAMEILYGTEELELQFYENLPAERLLLLNELWEELKIESSVSAAIIVLAGAIVVGCVGAGTFFAVRGRRRRRYITERWK